MWYPPTQRKLRLLSFLSAGFLMAGVALAEKPLTSESYLVRPPAPPDANAEGQIKAKLHNQKNEFEITAKKLDKGQAFEVWMEDPPSSGTLSAVGSLSFTGAVGRLKLSDPLPFGAADVTELAGRKVEVRSGGTIYLHGASPSFDPGGNTKKGFTHSRDYLVRPLTANGKARGWVEVWRKGKDNRQRFRIKTEHLPGQGTLLFYIENGPQSHLLALAGQLEDHDNDGDAKLYLDTKKGDALPLFVADVGELAGRCLQVRDEDGKVLLAGVIPDVDDPPPHGKGKDDLDGDGKGDIRLVRDDDSRFEIRLHKQGKKVKRDVYVLDGGGLLVLVDRIKADSNGDAVLKIRTAKGTPLPVGSKTLEELAGRTIEVRDVETGAPVMTGTIPALGQ